MFVQLIRAKLGDEPGAWRAMERWEDDLRAGAHGFLGSTSGVTNDGEFVLIARFDSEEAARTNSDRPEQGQWWSELQQAFAGEATFFESGDVDVSMGGGSDDAGFVQILVGRGNRDEARSVIGGAEAVLRKERPDIIGGITAWRGDGSFIDVAYFRSEAEAREGEAKELSEEGRALFETFAAVLSVEEYLDLPRPRLT